MKLRASSWMPSSLHLPKSIDVGKLADGTMRRRVVLNSHGCSVPTCTMCPLRDESVPASVDVTNHHLIAQVNTALEGCEEQTLTIYNNGNFFANREIPASVRRDILGRVAQLPSVKTLVVESLPVFITAAEVESVRQILRPDQRLVVAIGLQAWSEDIRSLAINSPCKLSEFFKVHELLRASGYGVQAFLMFGAPFITTVEAINDTRSAVRALSGTVDNIIISPIRIAPNTLASKLHAAGLYQTPSMWSMRELLRCIVNDLSSAAHPINVRIAKSILTGADGMASERPECSEQFLTGIDQFNSTGSIELLEKLDLNPNSWDCTVSMQPIADRIKPYIQ